MPRPKPHPPLSGTAAEPPKYADRRLDEIAVLPALSFIDVANVLGLPLSTLQKLHREGRGPKFFKLGRRLYVRQKDLHAWFDSKAKEEAA